MTFDTIQTVEASLAENMPATAETREQLPTNVRRRLRDVAMTELACRCLVNDLRRIEWLHNRPPKRKPPQRFPRFPQIVPRGTSATVKG